VFGIRLWVVWLIQALLHGVAVWWLYGLARRFVPHAKPWQLGSAVGLFAFHPDIIQQQAMLMVLPATMLPTIILSGFIFPIKSMALFLQALSCILPATWFLVIIRGIILKGVGVMAFWQPLLVLSAIGLFLFMVTVKRFKVKL
jgi:ABC-2 type transport system permease protein